MEDESRKSDGGWYRNCKTWSYTNRCTFSCICEESWSMIFSKKRKLVIAVSDFVLEKKACNLSWSECMIRGRANQAKMMPQVRKLNSTGMSNGDRWSPDRRRWQRAKLKIKMVSNFSGQSYFSCCTLYTFVSCDFIFKTNNAELADNG